MEPKLSNWYSVRKTEEYFDQLAAEKLAMRQQQNAYDDIIKNGRRLSHMIHVAQVHPENEAMIAFKREKERRIQEYNRQADASTYRVLAEFEKRQLEKAQQRKLDEKALRKDMTEQIRKKKVQLEMQKQEEKKEDDKRRLLAQRHMLDMKKQAVINADKKRRNLLQNLEDISKNQLRKEMEKKSQKAEDEHRKRLQQDIEQHKRPSNSHERIKLRQRRSEFVAQKLEAIQKEKAAMLSVREKKNEVESLLEKLQREKKDKRVARHGLSEYWEIQIKRKEEEKIKEKRRDLEFIEANRKSDLLSAMREKEKAQKKREKEIQVVNTNFFLAKHAEQKKKDQQRAAVKTTGQSAERDGQLQQSIQTELLSSAGFKTADILERRKRGNVIVLDNMDQGYNCSQTNEPLPRMSTKQTRYIIRYHERNSAATMLGQKTSNFY